MSVRNGKAALTSEITSPEFADGDPLQVRIDDPGASAEACPSTAQGLGSVPVSEPCARTPSQDNFNTETESSPQPPLWCRHCEMTIEANELEDHAQACFGKRKIRSC